MNNMSLNAAILAKNGMTMDERLSEALIMVVMGMLMVFAVLTAIMLVLMLTARLFTKNREPKPAPAAPKSKSEPVVPAVEASSEAVPEDNGAVVAAISAAIATMLAETGHVGGFRVVSFKRVGGKSAWNAK